MSITIPHIQRNEDECLHPVNHELFLEYLAKEDGMTKHYHIMLDVIEACPRVEYTVYDDGKPVGCFALMRDYDMHFGNVCVVGCHFMKVDSRKIHKMFFECVKGFSKTFGCKYYQRTHWDSPFRQTIITKEI